VYNISTINDSTTDSDVTSKGEVTTGAASILQGLVTFKSSDTPLTCTPNSSNPSQIDCTSASKIHSLKINGTAITPGTYSPGTSFAVAGSINDPECLLGA
jgi:hypothetical protein